MTGNSVPGAGNSGGFFLPGPTMIHPEVAAAMLRPMISHRGAEFRAMFARIQAGLRDVFATRMPVAVVPSSATAMMEMGIRSVSPGAVLSLVNGGFSARFADVAAACGRDVVRQEVPWGHVHDMESLRRNLGARQWAAVTVVHCETTTGVLTDVREVATLAREAGVPALVDAVSSLGGAACEADAWGLDFVFTGSQKTLALPPGLGIGVASEALIARARATSGRGFYLDLPAYVDAAARNETPTTPALSLLNALDVQVARVAAETMPARLARHAAMAGAVHQWVERVGAPEFGVGIVAPVGHRAPTVTAFTLPPHVRSNSVLAALGARGFRLGAGYGPLKGASVRMGHFGEHTQATVTDCLAALTDALREVSVRRG